MPILGAIHTESRRVQDAAPLAASPLIRHLRSVPQRELYFFALYRVLEAGLMAALFFSPLTGLIEQARLPALGQATATAYLACALVLLVASRNERRLAAMVIAGTAIDIAAATLASHALPAVGAGIATMLMFNVAAAAMLLPLRTGLAMAALASIMLAVEYLWTRTLGDAPARSLAELAMFATAYLALAWFAHGVARRARSSQALADRRGAEVANLVEVNELIIRRMRTGVLVVDAAGRITLANEAAGQLLGDTDIASAPLLDGLAPVLAQRLQRWRNGWQGDESPLQLAPDQQEVQPRFVRLLADSDLTLIFLDDVSVVSRRAESLTLATMGRFSATRSAIRWPPSSTPRNCWRNPTASAMPTAACCRSSPSSANAPTASSRACSVWPVASAPSRNWWNCVATCSVSSTTTGRHWPEKSATSTPCCHRNRSMPRSIRATCNRF